MAQVNLSAPAGARRPAGIAEILTEGRRYGIVIEGKGLPANTRHNAYAVWLTQGRGRAKLLGFVDPPVKAKGALQTAGTLPPHPFRYHRLIITRETSHSPGRPGPVVLSGRLR